MYYETTSYLSSIRAVAEMLAFFSTLKVSSEFHTSSSRLLLFVKASSQALRLFISVDSPLEFQIQTGLRHIKRGRNRDDTAKVDKSFLPILPCWLWRIQSFVGLMAHSRGISSRLNTLLMCLSVSYTFLILHGALVYFLSFFQGPKAFLSKGATFLLETAVLTRTTRMMENKIGNPSMSSPVMRTLVFLWIQLDTAVAVLLY